MILSVLKYFTSLYVLLAACLFAGVRGGRTVEAALVLLGLIVAITVLGLLLGLVLSVLIRRPKYERVFYSIGQLVALGLSLFLF